MARQQGATQVGLEQQRLRQGSTARSGTRQTRPDAQGKFSLKVPHGLEDVQLDISTNEHASAQHRIGKDGPLIDGRTVKLGTLDHDVKGIEIVRYVAPIIVINATTKGGQQVKGFKAAVEYTSSSPDGRKDVHVVGGGPREAIQDEQYDGRYRTSQLLPDREVNVTVSADGFKDGEPEALAPRGEDRRGDLRAGAEVTPDGVTP